MSQDAPGDGVDGELEFSAPTGEKLGELLHVVLRLRDRNDVPRHDDRLARKGQHDGRVVGLGGTQLSPPTVGPPPSVAAPKLLKSTLPRLPFMARAISYVSSVPAAPTTVRATTIAALPST